MHYVELLDNLQNLANKNKINFKIKQADIARALKTSTSNLSQKFNNPKSEVTISDLEKIQNYLGIYLYMKNDEEVIITSNTKERQYIPIISRFHYNFGKKLEEIKIKNELTDIQMANLLNISESELKNLEEGNTLPDLLILDNIKQNFKISIDWLLYGD